MPYLYDDQLIDAVSVRRRRLAHALMFAAARQRRQWSDQVRYVIGSAFLAVLVCAGCVAVSFVADLLQREREEREQQGQSSVSVVDPTSTVTPGVGP